MFAIYFVCTGNRCRSPAAAAVMGRVTEGIGVTVGSAGLLELAGERPPSETVAAARGLGFDLRGHRSVPLSGVDLSGADLVLGFERRHVAGAVVDGGAAHDRTFNLIELSSLLRDTASPSPPASDPIDLARLRVGAAHRARVETARFVPGEEVSDPMGRALPAHIDMVERVRKLCTVVAAELFGADAIHPSATRAGPDR
ncbi:MAG: hypothetical protein ACRDJV_03420 [Actinomycetota bacterium]